MAVCCGRRQTAHTWTDPRFALPPCPLLSSHALPQTPETKEKLKGKNRNEKRRKAPPSSLMRFSPLFWLSLSKFCARLLLLSDNLWLLLLFLLFLFTCVSHVTRSLQGSSPLSSSALLLSSSSSDCYFFLLCLFFPLHFFFVCCFVSSSGPRTMLCSLCSNQPHKKQLASQKHA